MEYFDLLNRAKLYTIIIGASFLMGYTELRKAELDLSLEDLRSCVIDFGVENTLASREFRRGIEIDIKERTEKTAKIIEEVNVKMEKERIEFIFKLKETQEVRSEELNVEKERFRQWKINLEKSLQ